MVYQKYERQLLLVSNHNWGLSSVHLFDPVNESWHGRTPTFLHLHLYLGKCTGFSYPHGSRVRVPAGMGTGSDSPTRDLQNKPKNMFFGGELNEIQPIS